MNTNIQIEVNGSVRGVQEGTTVAVLVQMLALSERKIAVEINRQIVPQSQHQQTQLQDGDQVEIIEAIGGG
ncbi:MAG: sulfur carrier protein ThiS [Chromatiales bacterium]|nr:sulfur carrier protein ThiS [Chromatiales bacterium]